VVERSLVVGIFASLAVHAFLLALPLHRQLQGREVAPPPLNASFVVLAKSAEVVEALPAEKKNDGNPPLPREMPEIVELTAEPPEPASGIFDPDRYLPVKEASRGPEPSRDWDELAWRLPPQAAGAVVMTLYLSDRGTVDRVEYLSSTSSELNDWIENALLKGQAFIPAEKNGWPIPVRLTIEIDLSALRR